MPMSMHLVQGGGNVQGMHIGSFGKMYVIQESCSYRLKTVAFEDRTPETCVMVIKKCWPGSCCIIA